MNWKTKFFIWKMRTRVRFITWVRNHQIVFCVRCKKNLFAKDAQFENMTTGGSAPLCKACREELYTPFGEK